MNILGVGFPELVLIFAIMIVVAGPKRMIQWAYTIGVYMGKLRNLWSEVVQLVQEEINQTGMDVQLPKDLPTRQNLNKWAQNVAKDYTQSVEQELKKAQDVLDIPQDAFKPSQDKPSWLPSASQKTSTKPQPTGNAAQPEPTTPPASTTLGSWGQVSSYHQPKPAVSNFGTWGNNNTAPQEQPQQDTKAPLNANDNNAS